MIGKPKFKEGGKEMKEEFVTYEVSLKLKEKGFREKCVAHYFNDEFVLNNSTNFRGVCVEDLMMSFNALCDTKDLYPNFYKCADAPTIDQVLRWLRKEKGLHIEITASAFGYSYIVSKTPSFGGSDIKLSKYEGSNDGGAWDEWEECALVGIEYVLCNLI